MNKQQLKKDMLLRIEKLVQNYAFWRSFTVVVLALSLGFIVIFSRYDVRWDILAVLFVTAIINFVLSYSGNKLARELSAFLTVLLAICLFISLIFSGIFYLFVLI